MRAAIGDGSALETATSTPMVASQAPPRPNSELMSLALYPASDGSRRTAVGCQRLGAQNYTSAEARAAWPMEDDSCQIDAIDDNAEVRGAWVLAAGYRGDVQTGMRGLERASWGGGQSAGQNSNHAQAEATRVVVAMSPAE
uniref:Uncharacterized protein n=1 Tax=Haptolina brevifila TaxID=156173 RepID=A0A7S2NBR5_9EUKA|mmetsp:Transcript_72795/g.144654  ORF Transcript_72795/g.144654 Transcript_72795/m.144654 type:complete len:141 (+) Transcript_72795:385-807(+)